MAKIKTMQKPGNDNDLNKSGKWWLLLLLVFALVLNFVFIDWGLPNHYTWAPDTLHPLLVINAMDQHFSGGWYGKYPPLHYMLTAAVYLPVIKSFGPEKEAALYRAKDIFYEDPSTSKAILDLNYPYKTMLSTLALASRAFNALITTLLVLAIYAAGKEAFSRRTGLWAALIVLTHPAIIFYGHTMNTEAPMFLWCALTLYCYFRVLKRQDLVGYLGLGIFSALATATKDQSFGIIALLPVVLLYARAAHNAGGRRPDLKTLVRALIDSNIVAGAACFIVTFVLGANLLFNFDGFQNHLALNTPGVNMLYRVYPLNVSGLLELLGHTLSLLNQTATPVVSVLCVIGLVFALRSHGYKTLLVLLPAVSYFAVFIVYIGFLTPRYVTPMFLVLALFGGRCLADLVSRRSVHKIVHAVAVTAVVGYLLWLGAGTCLLFKDDPRYDAEKWIQENIPLGSTVGIFAEPDHTVCRLPKGRNYPPIQRMIAVVKAKPLLDKTGSDYFMLNVFPDNMKGRELKNWLPALEEMWKKMGFEMLAMFEPVWPHPAWQYLYLNPYVIVAGRK